MTGLMSLSGKQKEQKEPKKGGETHAPLFFFYIRIPTMFAEQRKRKTENDAREAVTAGKDTADLICFEQTSGLQLNAIYKQRATDDMYTHTQS